MSVKMGKYQQEYYNLEDLDMYSPMYEHKDAAEPNLMWTESLKEDIDLELAKLAREGSGWGKTDQERIVDSYESGYCPHCSNQQKLEELDHCPKHGDVYETYLAAKSKIGKPELNEEEDAITKAVSGSHYNDVVPGFQYMQMMQYMLEGMEGVESHLLGQVYKYLMRSGRKDDIEQEYRKARWYLNCLIKYKQTGKIDPNNND